jgi:signal peptide peptidase SppA
MMKNPGWLRWFGIISTAEITAMVKLAAADDTVKNTLLYIDSPGGEVDGVAELGDTILAARAAKPVVAYADDTAASAAYWAAAQANKLYLDRLGAVGSIGVFAVLYDLSGMYEAMGVKTILLTTGAHKGVGAEGTTITPEQQAEFQRVVDLYYQAFTQAVAAGRGLSAAAVSAVADGRMFFGGDAVKAGLADRVQTLDTTLANIDQNRGLRKRAADANARQARALRSLPDLE